MMKRVTTCILAFHGLLCLSQNYNNDAQIRLGVSVEKKLSKRFSLYVQQQDRITNNVSEFHRASGTAGLSVGITRNIRLYADYTRIYRRNGDVIEAMNRYSAALGLKKDFGRWRFSYRNKVQFRYQAENSEQTNELHLYDRNKVEARYHLNKRLAFYLAEEVYIPLNSESTTGIERSRSYAGMLFNTFKHQQIEVYFLYQAQLQQNDWFKQRKSYPGDPLKRYYVYGINYNIEF